jgi:hypothetical protein
MFSMSFGFRSAMRLTPLSCVDAFEPAAAPRTAFDPGWMASLLMITPSTMMSGSELPRIVLAPRMRNCAPPPGAPEFVAMFAPAILPWSAFSTVGVGARFSCSADTCATSFAALRRLIVVAAPVTTCVSSCRTSRLSWTTSSDCPAGSGATRCW